jgi:hypothetical protein
MRQAVFLLAASTIAVMAQNTTSVKEVILEASKQFKLQYNIINETSANPTLNATLSISGFDTSKWTTADGKTGLYLGLGFGGSTMMNIDSINCLYFWTNKTTDAFSCFDLYFDANRQPVTTTESQDARNVRTGAVNVRNGIFTVNFQRLFKTADPAPLDYPLTLNDTSFIWSYGNIMAGTPVQHSISGTVSFNVQSGQLTATESVARFLQATLAFGAVLFSLSFF